MAHKQSFSLNGGPVQKPRWRRGTPCTACVRANVCEGACVCVHAAEALAWNPVFSVLKNQLHFTFTVGRVLLFPDTESVAGLA